MREEIRVRLRQMSDTAYQEFSASLVPASGRGTMLGVRLPLLRKYAKELAKEDWRAELSYKEDLYFEETMLRGMIFGCACKDIEELFVYLTDFIPQITNWSVCDSVCSGLKLTERCPERTWEFLEPFLKSGEEFSVRFGLIMLLNHFVKLSEDGGKRLRKKTVTMAELLGEEETSWYADKVLEALDREYTEGYYAQMAAAWLLAEMFVTYPARTLRGLKELRLDVFTRRKAVQKIRESRIPDPEVKRYLREMFI